MSKLSKCFCESCPGAACQCGCQSPKTEPATSEVYRGIETRKVARASRPLKAVVLNACLLLSFGLTCFGETVGGHLMPSKCKNDDPETHTKECALMCKSSGFGVVTADGKYRPFTPEGNTKAIALLESTGKTGDLRVTVQGTQRGAFLAVESITWK